MSTQESSRRLRILLVNKLFSSPKTGETELDLRFAESKATSRKNRRKWVTETVEDKSHPVSPFKRGKDCVRPALTKKPEKAFVKRNSAGMKSFALCRMAERKVSI